MKIIGWIILSPVMCIVAPMSLLGACVSEAFENWYWTEVQNGRRRNRRKNI